MHILRQRSVAHRFSFWLAGFFFLISSPAMSQGFSTSAESALAPVATDSRIKTFVYSENDVFNIVTHYGYQSNIEFGLDEQVGTVSVGDRVPFQIIPAGRRLFIRPMLASAHTNMTVLTNKHAYQFDLIAAPAPAMPNEELAYVVRFFYPGDKKNLLVQHVAPTAGSTESSYNYKYTFTGSDQLTPLKVFDDGKSTFFKLRNFSGKVPIISIMDDAGREVSQITHINGDYIVADMISPRFTIRSGDYMVIVYNERLSSN